MAWIYKRNDSGVWWIGTRANGRLIQKSTKETDKAKAQQKLLELEAMEADHRAGRLNREWFESLTGAQVAAVTLPKALDTWLNETTNPNTLKNYKTVAEQLRKAMPHSPLLTDITHEQMRAFLAEIRATKRPSTANLALACCRAFFGRFKGAVRKDPTDGIPRWKDDNSKVDREAFTPEQIRQVLAIAPPFWRCAAAVAFYTGLRLSNIALLKVSQLKGNKIVVGRTIKTGAAVCVSLPTSIVIQIREQIPSGAGNEDYIWPDEAKHAESGDVTNLSGQFATLLVKSGIRKAARRKGKGESGRRTVNALTFHSLRHSLVSALANAGVNQQVVKKFVGHSSTRVNDAYTHIKQDALDKAVALLPDITKEPES